MNIKELKEKFPVLEETADIEETDSIEEVKKKVGDALERAELGYRSYVNDIQGLSHLRLPPELRSSEMQHLVEQRTKRSKHIDQLLAVKAHLEKLGK